MTDASETGIDRAPTSRATVAFVPLTAEALHALATGDLDRAAASLGRPLPAVVDDERWLWSIRDEQVGRTPADLDWVVRLLVDPTTDEIVGHAGFHGAPSNGVAEVGYTVFPEHRGRGYARAALAALIGEAGRRGVNTVRATVSPDNVASHRVLAGFGFEVTGEQWDDEDGLEVIHDLTLD